MRPLWSRLPTSPVGMALTALLALPFAIIGSFLAYRTVSTVIAARTMQGWPTVPATLQHVGLEARGSNSQMAVATYSYFVNGQQFNGKRVSLFGADNIGRFQQKAYDELRDYSSRQAPYPAHVNPRAPNDAILMPVVRWEIVGFSLLFVLLFGGAGWGTLTGTVLAYKRLLIEKNLVAQYPDQPWRQRIEWSTPQIPSDQNSTAVGSVILALMWNVCAWPMALAAPDKLKAGEYFGLVLLLFFPVLGFGMVYWAIVSIARARRFGRTYLELETFPVRQGGHLRGRISAPAALGDATRTELVISCERHVKVSGGRTGTSVETKTLWKQEIPTQAPRGHTSSGDVAIDVDIAVPADLPDSSRDPNEWITWQLAASASLQGADFEAEFEVPVFKG